MKQTHKKALLVAALLSAALAGTMLALSPSWERRREKQEQEAMIVRLAGEEAQGTEASPRTEPETELCPFTPPQFTIFWIVHPVASVSTRFHCRRFLAPIF